MNQQSGKTKEYWFFWIIVVLNALPVLSYTFFPTLDGPAHLYNSELICYLINSDGNLLENLFLWNQTPVPNWTSHFLLTIFNVIFPAWLAEKCYLILYMVSLPWAFRSLIMRVAPENKMLSYLIFPFTYSFLFYLGFYNFTFGLIFMFLVLKYWFSLNDNPGFLKAVGMLGLMTMTYFSHGFVFVFLCMVLSTSLIHSAIIEIFILNVAAMKVFTSMMRKTFFFLFAAAPGLYLYFRYFSKAMGFANSTFVPAAELTDWLFNMRSLIALNVDAESPLTSLFFYVIVLLVVVAVAARVGSMLYNAEKNIQIRQSLASYYDLLLIAAVAALVLYFALPDFHDLAGYNSTRTQLMFFLLITAWACCQKIPKWVTTVAVIMAFYVQYGLLQQYNHAAMNLSADAVECNRLSSMIEPGSIVYPIDKSDNWLKAHFSNYLGIDKPMVILENYEASIGYFPLIWNEEKLAKFREDNYVFDRNCGTLPAGNAKKTLAIDYVFVLGNFPVEPDECDSLLLANIHQHFELAGQGPVGSLFRIRKNGVATAEN